MEHSFPPLLILLVCAASAPAIANYTRRVGLSVVVIELLLGVMIGPQGFGWVTPTGVTLTKLATLGVAFLFFIAGLEIDLPAIRGQPLRLALVGWVCGLGLSLAIAFGMHAAGLNNAWGVVAIALMTTALGVLVPLLRDGGAIHLPFGRNVMAIGVIGELGPILAISLVLSHRFSADMQVALTLLFVVIVLLLAWMMMRGARLPRLVTFVKRGFDQSGQTPIRIALVLIVGLAVLAEDFGLDLALGALAAGMVVGVASRGGSRAHDLHAKIDALGFGFLVPIFFLSSGMKLDFQSALTSSDGLALVAIFFVALLAVRLPLVLLLQRTLGFRDACAVALLAATTLPLVVVITRLAVDVQVMPESQASPMVVAGMLSVILFPSQGFRLAAISALARADVEGREAL